MNRSRSKRTVNAMEESCSQRPVILPDEDNSDNEQPSDSFLFFFSSLEVVYVYIFRPSQVPETREGQGRRNVHEGAGCSVVTGGGRWRADQQSGWDVQQ